ncbi:MAG: hypothetical protein KAS46_03960 [Candidatus Aureabacteria bacterium]|nr:hypothetical protein [Candidatus Auribacterota bacterium]
MRTKLILGVFLFLTLVFTNSAFSLEFDDLYTVATDGSTTLKNTFGWNEQPWLYLNLPSPTMTFTVSWWNPDGTSSYYDDFELVTSGDKAWHSLDNWSDVGGPRQLGYWNLRADFSSADGTGTDTANFTVTPEPVNSALFLLGGTFLAFGYRWKAKRKKKV